jgi:ABC-type branched-subunit amino acid transport system permease subunit
VSMLVTSREAFAERSSRSLFIKWLVALLVPLAVFTFVWNGEEMINRVILSFFAPDQNSYSIPTAIQVAIFLVLFYATVIALTGYFVAADSGRRSTLEVWLDVALFVLLPLFLFDVTSNLLLSLALCMVVWAFYILIANRLRKALKVKLPPPLSVVTILTDEQQNAMMNRAVVGGFWFATLFSVIFLIVDIVFIVSGTPFPSILIAWVVVRTLLLPVAGYFLGRLGGRVALRRTIAANEKKEQSEVVISDNGAGENGGRKVVLSHKNLLQGLSSMRAKEEAQDIVPNDLPMRSRGAQRFYLLLFVAFVLFYPALDPLLFGYDSAGRLSGYADAGYYIILALGLNIVVGFAGLLDLGYVAFFAIGSYVWGMFGSPQLQVLTGINVNSQVWPWLFWPMLIVGALIAAFWGVVLGAPTLRLRGDYLAIVTLGFGEIVPIVFLEMDKYTNGTNGLVGVYSPAFFGIKWSSFTPVPYYYLILALVVLLIFVNIRLRDSRLGRAWIAMREDEVAAASSGINLTRTKLFAFGAGAFFSGVAGVYYAAKLGTVTPDNFSSADSIIYLAMVVIGGLGSIPGVIVGAFVVYALNEFILAQLDTMATNPNSLLHVLPQLMPGFTFSNIRNLIFGVILVAVMIFRPEGLIPSTRRRRELHRAETETAEEGTLDVVPGTAEFESEVRVE